jgi:hypothetical protein
MTEPEPRDPRVDAAYREAANDEPRQETDDRILAAARRAVAAGPQSLEARARADAQRSWIARWRVPVSIAATVVVAVTLAYMMEGEEVRLARTDGVPASAPPPAPVASAERAQTAPASPPAPVQAPAAARAAPAADASNAAARPEPVPFPAPAASERRASEEARTAAAALPPPAVSRADEAPAAGALSKGTEQRQAELERLNAEAARRSASPAPRLQSAPAPATPAAAPPARERALADRPAERMEREAAAGIAEQKARTPEAWLEDLRRLKAQQRTEDFTRELAEFRKRYPDYKLPADLLQ